jgi:8-amino-7-oxononanoate synthase
MPTAIDLFEKARRHERLEQLRAAREHDLMPYFRVVEAEPGPIALMEGKERITLGSNNYLGLTGDPRVKAAARDALEHYGTGLTGSRFMNGTTPLHLELERELADWMGSEDAIVYTTGYLANTGAIGTLLDPGDTVVCDSGDHASILDAVALSRARVRPFRHNRLDKLETMLSRAESDGGGVLVVVDGLFSMEGDLSPLPDVAALCREHGARLMVDEAHAVGVLGELGRGASELLDCEDDVDIRMGTFSKSLASCGGFIAGPHDVIDFLRVQSRSFMFTAAAVPAAMGAALGALRIIRSDEGAEMRAKVLDNARYLHDGLGRLGYGVMEPNRLPDGSDLITPIVPVLVGDDWKAVLLWKALYDAGVYVNVAIYPAVQRGGALLRTSVMASHEREHLDQALAIFERVKGEVEAMTPPDVG